MRSYSLLGMMLLLAGCSGGQDLQGTATDEVPGAPSVGKVQQKAQFADNTIINLVDPLTAALTLTADGNPVDIQVFYMADKTTDTGRTPAAPTLITTLSLATDQTVKHVVNLNDPAFNGGYGSVILQSTDQTNTSVYQTYVQYGGSIFSTGGSTFEGTSYRVPYLAGTIRVVLAFTSQAGFNFDLTISNVNGTQTKTVTMVPLTTYKFDSLAEGWALKGDGSIQVFTQASGTVAVSGYVDRFLQRLRITPVKAAPFP